MKTLKSFLLLSGIALLVSYAQAGIPESKTLPTPPREWSAQIKYKITIFSVSGRVVHANGSPGAQVRVRAMNVGFDSAQPIGESLTGADGRYLIRYSGGASGGYNLQILAIGPGGNEIGRSPVHYQVSSAATINLTIN